MATPKLFPNIVAGVLEALEMSFGKGLYADKVVERLLRQNKKWGSRDRSFVAEHTYEMVRWWALLWGILGIFCSNGSHWLCALGIKELTFIGVHSF